MFYVLRFMFYVTRNGLGNGAKIGEIIKQNKKSGQKFNPEVAFIRLFYSLTSAKKKIRGA